mmetsp:Transcript_1658/g.5787  ORF Transcript_1658/g.5787 Transcript_1658/m.5787 type:complete len:93 (+) Transcript_1658:2053-2331(+)
MLLLLGLDSRDCFHVGRMKGLSNNTSPHSRAPPCKLNPSLMKQKLPQINRLATIHIGLDKTLYMLLNELSTHFFRIVNALLDFILSRRVTEQ